MSEDSLYFIALIPPEKISSTLFGFKQEVAQKYLSKAALRSPPHVTLHMPFKLTAKKKDKLVNSLTKLCLGHEAFSITLNGFGAFPPRVIYIKVEPNERLALFQKHLGELMAKNMFIHNLNYRNKPFKPHITIAFRDLNKQRFNEAWAYYSSQSFEVNFQANSITLLKHDGKIWLPELSFPLQSKKTASNNKE